MRRTKSQHSRERGGVWWRGTTVDRAGMEEAWILQHPPCYALAFCTLKKAERGLWCSECKVGVCPSFQEGRLLAQAVCKRLPCYSSLLQWKGREILILSLQNWLWTLWEAVLHLSCAGPFCTNYPWTRSTFAKNSSKRNREFPELWSYQFCIIWLTIPLKVFILPLVKLKSVHSLVQELTSLWCYILCNGVRPGKAFTAKPCGELNLQCLKPCLNLISLLPSAFVNTCISKTRVISWKYPPVTQQHVAEDPSRVSLTFSLLFPWPHFFYNICERKSDCFTKLS